MDRLLLDLGDDLADIELEGLGAVSAGLEDTSVISVKLVTVLHGRDVGNQRESKNPETRVSRHDNLRELNRRKKKERKKEEEEEGQKTLG